MCGRIAQVVDPAVAMQLFGIAGPAPNAPVHYNGAPGQDFMVIRRDPESGDRVIHTLRWGLLPHWASDRKIAWKLINARCETVATLPAFRGAWKAQRRCVIPADAFYEWKAIGKVKQPYAIARTDGKPLALAGLWENWKDPETQQWVRTFTIVTTNANDTMRPLHDRMPVILSYESVGPWLDGSAGAELMAPSPEALRIWPVSTRVNTPKNDDPSLLDEIALENEAS